MPRPVMNRPALLLALTISMPFWLLIYWSVRAIF
jgi:hypothetical protein